MIEGNDLDEGSVERAIRLSAEKYCSATIMLSKSVEITHDFRITKQQKTT
jgi:putative redox protein